LPAGNWCAARTRDAIEFCRGSKFVRVKTPQRPLLTAGETASLTTSQMEWTDAAAAEEARLGNQQAFRVLVERHSHALFRLAYRMTGNEQDAEDLVQDTFLRAFKQLKSFDGRAAFGTWLHRICVNRSLDSIRARKSRREVSAAQSQESEGIGWLERVAAPQPSPERLTQSGQISDLLGPALQQLSDSERTAFVLRHYEGKPIEEIARTLGVQTNAAKHSVFRAVQKIRRALEPAWGVAR
jgi:RNA polymerase sigma-70 factor, ECF subfamily